MYINLDIMYFLLKNILILELNSPKTNMVKVGAKTQDIVVKPQIYNLSNMSTTENGITDLDCKKYMISLEKELGKLLKNKPSIHVMSNMGMNLRDDYMNIIFYYIH